MIFSFKERKHSPIKVWKYFNFKILIFLFLLNIKDSFLSMLSILQSYVKPKLSTVRFVQLLSRAAIILSLQLTPLKILNLSVFLMVWTRL